MKKYPLISVVMLNYNGLSYLKRTVHPILKLDYPDYEFIIVDNGSTDGSIDFIKKFRRIRLIRSPRAREKNFACNYAIKRAKGEYILLLDNDILNTNSKILNELIKSINTTAYTGSIGVAFMNEGERYFRDYGGFFNFNFIKTRKVTTPHFSKNLDQIPIGFAQGACLFIKKSIWQEVEGYDEHLKFGGDDNDLGIRLWINSYNNYLYAKTLQVHIGLSERQDDKKYSLKFKEMFYAHLYTIVKDFTFSNMIITLVGHSIFMFLKSIKQAIFRFNIGPFLAFFQGYHLFLKDLPYALKKRKEIQSKRIIKEDIFLKIKPPRFD